MSNYNPYTFWIDDYFGDIPDSPDDAAHYGMPRRSGRYPWGSGENPYQHSRDFLARYEELRNKGLSETEIADQLHMKTTKLRTMVRLANEDRRRTLVAEAKSLREQGYSLKAIADKMGYPNDSSVRALLNAETEAKMNRARETAAFLKSKVDEMGMIEVGAGTEHSLGISKEKLRDALYLLELDGYPTYGGRVAQVTNKQGMKTTITVLCPPGTEHKEIFKLDIHTLDDYISYDNGETFKPAFHYPESLDSSRLEVLYKENGGLDKDGLIELRRGVEDISLGESDYAQVRILVDGTHYLKGMAVYSDDLPPGVDVRFNSNKPIAKGKMAALKEIEPNPDNPFGSYIKEHGGQRWYVGEDGKEHLSVINKRADEGDWGDWADKLPSQFLAKQNKPLIERQLKMTLEDMQAEYDDIMLVENPVVKRKLLNEFASKCDSDAVHLQAAALPRQKYQVILPLKDIKDTEIYAPNYQDGEQVALIRYPHGGTFEIPILTVNNKNAEGVKVLGKNAADAVGINKNVADRLSGADFDGDTVMVIPTGKNGVNIQNHAPLKGLEGFDSKIYAYSDAEISSGKAKLLKKGSYSQKLMGEVSNLIMDMTIQGANEDELAAAVRHSMVIIDAPKHKLNYKQSEVDNNIAALKKKYQGHIDDEDGRYHEGASTLITKAKSEKRVPHRIGTPKIDPETGELIYKYDEHPEFTYYEKKTKRNKQGDIVSEEFVEKKGVRDTKSTKMAETKDAHTLSSGSIVEEMYADFANAKKAMANTARKSILAVKDQEYNPEAATRYADTVRSLQERLEKVEANRPKERMAQILANQRTNAKMEDFRDVDKQEYKKQRAKIAQQELSKARAEMGASRHQIELTDADFEAIASGAIRKTTLVKIINNSDMDIVRQHTMPREQRVISDAKRDRVKSYAQMGYTNAQIAEALGISASTVSSIIRGKDE